MRAQLPIILDDWSEPEPDVAVCAPDPYHYAREHPKPKHVLLICEVAVSSLTFDQTEKAAAYAASGIPAYWIVDVEGRVIQVLADPEPAERRYRRAKVVPYLRILPADSADSVKNALGVDTSE